VADKKMPGTAVKAAQPASNAGVTVGKPGHLDVSELISSRAAAPSPFGDDQTFPLPVENLTYTATVTP
jgi:hypothetical protein